MASSSADAILTFIFFFIILISMASLSTYGFNVTDINNKDANTESISPAVTVSEFVAAHNAARKAVGVPPLVWDRKLATFARVYANQRRADCTLIHSPGYAYGENIFWGQGRRWRAKDIVASWVREKRWYHYSSNSCSGPDCSHYTQIVWRNTARIGCAKIVCNTGDTFSVCEYFPPGNYIGARPYVKPPKKP